MPHPFQPEKALREARDRDREAGLAIELISDVGVLMARNLAMLEQIAGSLASLHEKVDDMSQDQSHLTDAVNRMSAALDGLAADMAAEVQALKDAQNQNPAQPLDFGALDTLVSRAESMAADNAPAAPPAAGTTGTVTSTDGTVAEPVQGVGADVPPAS